MFFFNKFSKLLNMKKLFVLFSIAFLAVSVIGQNPKNHSGFLKTVSKQKIMSIEGINKNFLNFHSKNIPSKQLPHLKEANVLKQRLDSVVAPGFDKDEYVYDANGNVLLDNYFEWDGSQWVKSWKDEYTYDGNGNQIQNISYEWNGSQWVILWKYEFIYDANHNQLQEVNYDWDGSNWVNSYKSEFVYDLDNNMTQSISYYGSELPDGVWINGNKNEFVYDENGNLVQNISFSWYNEIWENTSKTEFILNDAGTNIQTIQYGWEGDNWASLDKYEYVYDTNQNISQVVISEWNSIEWMEAAKYEFRYDANQNMILSNLIYFFEDQLITFMKEESVYDDFGNRISYSFYTIDDESEEFTLTPIWKEEYVYDNSFTFDDLILPFMPGDLESDTEFDVEMVFQMDINLMFKHKLTQLTYYEGDGDSWLKSGDYTVYYSEQNITGVKDLNVANNVNVYPNPATNQITFNIDASVDQLKVDFYDIQGKLVLSQLSNNNKPVLIESLNEGLYFYRLSENQNFYSGKFMVK